METQIANENPVDVDGRSPSSRRTRADAVDVPSLPQHGRPPELRFGRDDRRSCGMGGRRDGDEGPDPLPYSSGGVPRASVSAESGPQYGRAAVRDRKRTVKGAPPLTDDTLWDAEAVARFLTVSRSMVYKLEQTGGLPCVRIGACIRFEPATVRAYARGELRGRPNGGGVMQLDPRRPR